MDASSSIQYEDYNSNPLPAELVSLARSFDQWRSSGGSQTKVYVTSGGPIGRLQAGCPFEERRGPKLRFRGSLLLS
jgi:hypothetical protein